VPRGNCKFIKTSNFVQIVHFFSQNIHFNTIFKKINGKTIAKM